MSYFLRLVNKMRSHHVRNGNFHRDDRDRKPTAPRGAPLCRRRFGYALVHAAGIETIDEVVFGEQGDMVLLGSRSLEGMNLRVDAREKRLTDAGPIAAAVAS